MKLTLKLIVPSLLAVVAIAGGCNSNKKGTTQQSASKYPPMNQAALDIPATPPAAPAATYTPVAAPQPVVYDAPAQPVIEEAVVDASDAVAPVRSSPPRARKSASSVASSGTKYKVKKGESLWTIAQAKYGNGNKWKAIAAANPKLNPDKVQAGQTITLP